MTLVWVKSLSGWGTTEYRAKSATGGVYLAKKTGGRFNPWSLTLDGKRLEGMATPSCSTLRSAKAIAEMREARA